MKSNEKESLTHESYGIVEFHRINGRANFYGSELEQDNYIILTISNSEIDRTLTSDRYYPNKQLIQVRLTAGQFSELITSMNMGSGIPCTIEKIQGKKVEPLPEIENRKEFVHKKFKERMKDFANSIRSKQKETKELVNKKTLTKEEMRLLNFNLDWLTTEVENNIPFFAECFQETMDNVVFEAKLNVENAIQHKITALGLDVLHEQNKLLDVKK